MASSTCKCLRWAFRLPDWEPCFAEWLQVLQSIQEEETTRVMRFMFRDDSKSAAVGRLMLRASIAKLLNVPWSQVEFGRSDKGKPLLVNPTPAGQCPSFNISHHGDYVVLATDCGPYCGVDVMKIEFRPGLQRTVKEYLDLMRPQFSLTEWRTMERATLDRDKLALFYRYWCLKESFVKATGAGIHSDLASLDFRFDNDDCSTHKPALYLQGKRACDQWRFFEYELGDDHVTAVCTGGRAETGCRRENDETSAFEMVSIGDLLKSAQMLHAVDEGMCEAFFAKSYKSK